MKKYLTLLVSLLFPLIAMSDYASKLDNLDPLTWKYRIILVFSDTTEQYKTILEEAQSEIDDRDIVWFIIDGNQTSTNYPGNISDQFAANINRQFSFIRDPVILIGKDGGVKETSDLLALKSLFDEIDAMPMRINEMKEKSASTPE